jgi:hypothetical protein
VSRLRLALLLVAVAAAPPEPLTEAEVVRLLASGATEADVLRTIAARPPQFDLSEEMLEELRLAGVPARLVDAMRARQAEVAPPVTPAADDRRAGTVKLRVRLGGPPLVLPDRVPDGLARDLQLGASPEARRIDDLAVFLVCRTVDHVPDQWRNASPLGRDFASMPRHGMLAFHSGAHHDDADRVLRLELPAELVAEVEPGRAHDLSLGVAILVGERFLRLASADRDGVRLDSDGSLDGGLEAGAKGRVDVRLAGQPRP